MRYVFSISYFCARVTSLNTEHPGQRDAVATRGVAQLAAPRVRCGEPSPRSRAAARCPIGRWRIAVMSRFFGVCSVATKSVAVVLYPLACKSSTRSVSVIVAPISVRRLGSRWTALKG